MRFGRRHAQLQGGVIQRAWADPAQAFLDRLQHGKKQVAFRTRRQAVGTGVAVRSTQRSRFAWGRCKLFERRINRDRKSTRLNSSHLGISYAVFCLKKKNNASVYVL